jgi:hypothetical protein
MCIYPRTKVQSPKENVCSLRGLNELPTVLVVMAKMVTRASIARLGKEDKKREFSRVARAPTA